MSEQTEKPLNIDLEELRQDIILTSKLISFQMVRVQDLLKHYEHLPRHRAEINAKLKEIRRDSIRLERMMEIMNKKEWWRYR